MLLIGLDNMGDYLIGFFCTAVAVVAVLETLYRIGG